MRLLNILHIVFFILTCLSCASLSFYLSKLYYERRKNLIDITSHSEKAAVVRLKSYYKLKDKKEIRLFSFLNNLILKANIRLGYINAVTITLLSLLIFCISFLVCNKFTYWLNSLILAVFFMTIPTVVIYFIGQYIGERTDKSIIDFSNLCQNFLEIKDDITFAFENIAQFNLNPLSTYCRDYVFDIKHGYTSIDALRRFQNKISNAQLRRLFHTLINCNQNAGKYLLVVERFKNNYIELYDKLLMRKKEAYKARLSILVMIAIMAIIFICLISSNHRVLILLSTTFIGKIISSFTLVAFIFAFFIALNVGHFNFD